MDHEIWKNLPEYEGLYQVSNKGRVKSLHTMKGMCPIKSGHIKKPTKSKFGYLRTGLHKDHKVKVIHIHRLIMMAFVGPVPEGKNVNHIDGNKENNHLENLEYVTKSENILHAYNTGLKRGMKGENNHRSKLTYDEVLLIRTLYGMYDLTRAEIARQMEVSYATVSFIVNNKTWL